MLVEEGCELLHKQCMTFVQFLVRGFKTTAIVAQFLATWLEPNRFTKDDCRFLGERTQPASPQSRANHDADAKILLEIIAKIEKGPIELVRAMVRIVGIADPKHIDRNDGNSLSHRQLDESLASGKIDFFFSVGGSNLFGLPTGQNQQGFLVL